MFTYFITVVCRLTTLLQLSRLRILTFKESVTHHRDVAKFCPKQLQHSVKKKSVRFLFAYWNILMKLVSLFSHWQAKYIIWKYNKLKWRARGQSDAVEKAIQLIENLDSILTGQSPDLTIDWICQNTKNRILCEKKPSPQCKAFMATLQADTLPSSLWCALPHMFLCPCMQRLQFQEIPRNWHL